MTDRSDFNAKNCNNNKLRNDKRVRPPSNLFSFAITNARSLIHKIDSLRDHFRESDLAFAIVTETWLCAAPGLEDWLINQEHANGLSFINCMRKRTGPANPGGGVSIIYRKSQVVFKEFKVKRENYEFVCAKGKITNNTRPIFVLAAYFAPN